RFRPAHIARAARLPLWILPKMDAYLQMAAGFRLHETANFVVPLPRAVFLCRIVDLPDEVTQRARVAFLPKQHAIRGQPVTSSAARLLIELLDRFWQRQMNHRAHGR